MPDFATPPARLLVALALASCAHAAAAPAPKPPAPVATCGLAVPPPDAGIDRYLGAVLKVYPRNPAIGPDFNGCQTLWAASDDGWGTITVAHYAHGHVVRVDSPAQPGDPVERCRVQDGAVVEGDAALCAQLDDMRFESLPADCTDAADGGVPSDPARAAHCVRR